jgi:C4-dicarboxylate-specific signal transduction histidine kinase
MTLRPSRRLLAVVIGGWLGMSALGLAGLERYVASYRAAKEHDTRELLQTAVAGVSQQVERTMDAIETLHWLGGLLLVSSKDGGTEEDADRQIRQHLLQIAETERFGVLQVALVDAGGMLVWSTVRDFWPIDLSDREHIRVHREGRSDAFVSGPLIGRASGRWSIQITRPVTAPYGGFAGVVVVSLDPQIVSRELAVMRFLPEGVVTLLRTDGTVLARSESGDQHLGHQLPAGRIAILASAPQGVTRTVSDLTGREIHVAWQSLAPLPVILAAALPSALLDQDVAAERGTLLLALGATSLSLLTLSGALLILRARRHERAASDQAAREQRERSELLDALPGAVYRAVLGPDGQPLLVEFGAAITRIVDPSGNQTLADDVIDGLLAPEVAAARRHMLAKAAREGAAVLEYQLELSGHERRWVRDECRRLRSLPDGSIELVGSVTEITEERALKAKAESSAKLATLGEMATGVAHELSQPSAAIALAADVAVMALEDGSQRGIDVARTRLTRIADQATRIRDIIDHLQVFGRTDEGAPRDVEIRRIVSGALRIVGGTLRQSGVRVEIELPAALPQVRGRLVPLEQVLVNVLLNARDAMEQTPPEERVITIGAAVDAVDRVVHLNIQDSGSGIAPSMTDRLFEPFFTTKPVGKGTGLGLAIAYGTMRAFGGSIALQNRRDSKGALATLTLPFWQEPETAGVDGCHQGTEQPLR